MNKLSILQNFKPENLHTDPCPYITIENALPWDLYNQLAEQYPESALDGQVSGFRDFRYCQHDFSSNHITPLWQEFVDYHTKNREFKDDLIKIFEPSIRSLYPESADKWLNCEVALRNTGKLRETVNMEVQFVMNSFDAKSIRTPHLDAARELFACLFYMKKEKDLSTGGDLIIYKKTSKDFEFLSGRLAPLDKIQEAARIPYKANNLIIFLNSINSIHGVDPRVDATETRRYVNIDAHVIEKLFRF